MKPTAICSIVVLSLAALSLKTEAASAPDVRPGGGAAVRPEGSHSHAKNAVTAVAGKSAHVAGRASQEAAGTTGKLNLSTALNEKKTLQLHQTTAAASKRFSQEMVPVNKWANDLQVELQALAPIKTGQRAQALKGQLDQTLSDMKAASGGADVAVLPSRGGELSTYKQMLKTNVALILIATANMNHNIVKLAVEHDVNKATALCQEIRIDALHLAAMQKDIAGERAKSDALLKRAHMIKLSNEANERIMQLRLNRLSLLAKNYTQAFQALGNPAAVAVPAI